MDQREPIEIGDTVIYPPGTPEYRACTEFERDLMDTLGDTIRGCDEWQRRAEQADDALLTLRLQHDTLVVALQDLADSVQAFRNLPMLGRYVKLRATPEYAALVAAWDRAALARVESECR